MVRLIDFLLFVFSVFFLTGCARHPVTETQTETIVEVREVPVEVVDTVTLTIAPDTVWQVATDSSTLSNEWCKSRAWIQADGTLFHDLTTIGQEKRTEARYIYIRSDTTRTTTKTITVEKKPTRWQQVKEKYAVPVGSILLIIILAQMLAFKKTR